MRIGFALAGSLALAPVADARVTRLDSGPAIPVPANAGRPDFEKVSGTFHGELDPADPANRVITDLKLAPRNARGLVEYSATFTIARPADPAKASGVLVYSVANRGGGVSAGANPGGDIEVISGWQGDIPSGSGVQRIEVPVAKGKGGAAITGPFLLRLSNVPAGVKSMTLKGGLNRGTPVPQPVSLDTGQAALVIETRGSTPKTVAPDQWSFGNCEQTPFPGLPDPAQLCVKAGFDPDAAYTLTYQAKDPLVIGIGFAATRDLVAFLRSGRPDDAGNANPARGVRWTIGQGNSQSGNFLRSFVHLGFNADETGARVFDGINPNIAARQVPLNLRFGVPGGAANLYEPGSEGALWWTRFDDKARRRGVSSLLDRCNASHTCPKIIETLGSAEFWGLRASPGFVGTNARADLPLPANVRRYYFPSVTHGGAFTNGFLPRTRASSFGCMLPDNPVSVRQPMAILFRALVDWVRYDKAPPESLYPTLKSGDLVEPSSVAMGWPAIPGAPAPDGKINPLHDYDFGPGFVYRDVSGAASRQPPVIRKILPQRVPRVDSDGIETAGVPLLQLRVPLGTYTGWNVQAGGFGAGGGCGFAGGFIPFARTKAEREASGDPRPSLEERYGNHAGFVARVRDTAASLVRQGWLTESDAAAFVAEADASGVLK